MSAEPTTEIVLLVSDVAASAAALLADWANGSEQTARTHNCGDSTCGYPSCKLADAIQGYLRAAGLSEGDTA
jgi:hypothetical protein